MPSLYNGGMNIATYGHACFTLTKNDVSIVIDPGGLSPDFVAPANVGAVIITHLHGDHWSAEQLEKLPEATIYTVDDAAKVIEAAGFPITVARPGDEVSVGDFHIRFVGGEHALVHPNIPMCHNLGVLVDEGALYYPGDSLVEPNVPIEVLALPIAAPWMKTSEGMDFLRKLRPARAFPVHDGILSDAGKQFVDNWMSQAAEKSDTIYERL